MKAFNVLPMLALVALLALPFTACDSNSDNPVTTDPEVAAPTNLKAASADGAVFLSWDASIDESADNFGSYDISILNMATNETLAPRSAAKGITEIRIDGLTDGVRYKFTIRSVTELGNMSTGYEFIEWSPAVRQTTDTDGSPIMVYATTSTNFDSGVDLYNDNGKAEVIPQASQAFEDRGDMYVYASSNSSTLSIISPAEAINHQGFETQFSNESPVDTDNLDTQLADAPPDGSTYTLKELTLDNGSVTSGRIYWGRLVRDTDYFYFRLLVKKGANGKLVQGTGADRYIELVASFQNAPNNPYAKK